jgi:hypothetical protein
VKQKANPQLAINSLMKQWRDSVEHWRNAVEQSRDSKSAPSCKLGRELLSRRGGACSACKWSVKHELDREVEQLVKAAIFKRGCPYQIVAGHLLAGLTLGPEAFRARGVGRKPIDPLVELKRALTHVRAVLRACGLSRENIAALSHTGDRRNDALYAVLLAEEALGDALKLFEPRTSEQARSSPRGRTGALHNQALARALARAWRVLTGRLPAKDNVRFHGLLHAAATTIFGRPSKYPYWESATKRAVEQIRKETARSNH